MSHELESASADQELTPPARDTGVLANISATNVAIIIIAGIFATTLAQPQVLGKLPLQNLLKNEVHASREAVAGFFFWCGMAWYLKPIAGIFSDAFPLFRTKRRHYILISTALSLVGWLALGKVPHTYQALLWACIILNLFMVIASTAVGAILVEAGQKMGATGKFTSVRLFVQNACTLIQGPLGGFLASGSFLVASGVNAVIVFSLFPVVYFLLKERPQEMGNKDAFANAGKQLRIIMRSPNLWWAIAFLGLFYFSPGFGTTLFFRQQDEFKFSTQDIGNFGVATGLCGLAAAVIYSQLIKRLTLRTMILIGVVTGALGNFMYLTYSKNFWWDCLIEGQNGLFFTLAELALIDLAARSTPKGCEGLGYSLILSIRNVALFGADVLGSKLADNKWPFQNLVFLNSGTTLVVLILLPFLPAAVVAVRDRMNPTDSSTGAAPADS